MSAIIDNAETIRYQRQASIAQTKSQSGVRQAQRRGPVLYNFFLEIRPIQFGSNAYFAIEDEILDLNYSETTIDTTITNGNLTTPRGIWSGTPVVKGASQSGNTITIDGAPTNINSYARKGDFVQFNGSTKVYQLTEDVNSNTIGEVIMNLNGAVPATQSPADDSAVVFGSNVLFHLQLKDRPEPEFSERDIVTYSSASFEEVL